MAQIRVRVGRPTEIVHSAHRADAEAFVEELRVSGLDVDELEVIEYGGQRGVVLVEWIAIFVGSGVASSVIGNVTDDLYNGAKAWVRRRHERKKAESETGGTRPIGFLIYGPDGQELRKWSTLDEESEGDQPSRES